ncbi:hypothetical protein, conserved [Leishmania tarentolae]|uniref:Uncharacterized protein n=1 Tax=Leishmania tarentolae TaxID=5689 RepID=A0A640KVK0_LEITA|nr:hypothetical protein, conserved [Leishmania tarentolae]
MPKRRFGSLNQRYTVAGGCAAHSFFFLHLFLPCVFSASFHVTLCRSFSSIRQESDTSSTRIATRGRCAAAPGSRTCSRIIISFRRCFFYPLPSTPEFVHVPFAFVLCPRMPKKHRVKRENYVAHLRKLEKERDTYLQKRRAHKRSRDTDNEEVIADAHDKVEACAPKKRRTEAVASTTASARNETEAVPHTHFSVTKAAHSAATAKTVSETKDTCSAKPFAELVKASAAAAPTTVAAPYNTSTGATAAKKTVRRRNY